MCMVKRLGSASHCMNHMSQEKKIYIDGLINPGT